MRDVADLDLNLLRVLVAVVDAGSFTAAGRQLGMPKSTVSAHVARLEESLGVRLLQRTTRSLGLTDAGRAFYPRCARIVADAEEAQRALADLQSAPAGLLRITAPTEFSQTYLGGIVVAYSTEYPDVRVELVTTDQMLDLVEDGFDLAVRAGPLSDSSLIARRLAPVEAQLYASEAYLARARPLRRPDDLRRHACLAFTSPTMGATWHLRNRRGRDVSVTVTPLLTANSLRAVRDAAVAGAGVALLPVLVCAEMRDVAGLVRVLPTWTADAGGLHVVYPSSRHLSPKVRAFVDVMVRALEQPPWRESGRAALA